MPKIAIREYLNSDLDYLSEHLRESDKAEILALDGSNPKDGLASCIKDNTELWVITLDNDPVMLYGLKEVLPENSSEGLGGQIWALGTDYVFKHPRQLTLLSKKIISTWFQTYDFLFNYVWEGNSKHIKWIEIMGFTVFEDKFFTSSMDEKFLFFTQFYAPDLNEDED